MCCLNYESDLYKELAKSLPKIGTVVKTPKGIGKVTGLNILKQSVVIELESGSVVEFLAQDVNIKK